MGDFQMDDESTYGTKIEKIFPLALSSAINDSDVHRVRKVIENCVHISQAKWRKDANALHSASQYAKTTELIDVILETGQFDINGVDNDGETPLHYAINGRNPTIARHLIQREPIPKLPTKTESLHFSLNHSWQQLK
uniref:Uncharacterized protein n=1 Tax=Daphnia galeata TaxID=27404 RepID=A0A8J2WGR6_9CRUS|nr:unnamed protein product [Daphnia galeata]